MHIEFQKVYNSKSQAKCPLHRLSCMRKRLSVSFRVSWETTILPVNPCPYCPWVDPSVDTCAYLQTNYVSVTFFTDHPYWSACLLAMSVNFRWHPYSHWTPSGNIHRNFPSHYWCEWVKDVPDATRRSTGAVRTTYRLHTDQLRILINLASANLYGKFKQFDFSVVCPRTHQIRGGCHKDITDGTDMFTDEIYAP